MIYRIRLLATILLLEIGLAITWWKLMQPSSIGGRGMPVERAVALGEIMGTVMGAVLGLAFLLYFVARANDRRRAASRQP